MNTPAPHGTPLPIHDPRRILTSLKVVVYDWDLASDALAWGPNAAEVLGFDPALAWPTGEAFAAAVEPCDGPTRADIVTPATGGETLASSGAAFASLYRVRLEGRPFLVDDTGRWFPSEGGEPARVHGTMRLRQEPVPAEPATQRRDGFLAEVAADIAEAKASGRALTLFVLAVANLAELNDDLGFEAADRVMETVVVRLGGAMRRRDRFVRYSGNRFALALRGCGPAEAAIAAARLTHLVCADPVGTARGPVEVNVSIGTASAPDHAFEAATLLRRAEAALGLAKRRTTAVVTYDPKLFRQASRSRRDPMLASLDLLNGRRIGFALQPVVSAGTRRVAFREALLRVQGAGGDLRPAGDVVPALEQAGLVHLADFRMLELVAEHLARHPHERVSLNVSPVTLERPDWLATLRAHLGGRLDLASRLIVEVTETAAIREPQAMQALLEATRALGAAVAIDDFGAGYTSFRNLRTLPVDFVKIDGAFVQNLSRSADDRFFVRTLIDLSRHLGIPTVAEWVEDEASAAQLTAWGVDYLQGDHCGRPALATAPAANASLVA